MNFGFVHLAVARTAVFNDRNWPRAHARSIDFVAELLTAALHPQRLLWSRRIELSSDRTQSCAAYHGRGIAAHPVLQRSGESTLAGSKVSTPKLVGELS
jgi:hypothetical protein